MRRQVAFLFSGGVFVLAFAALIGASRWMAEPQRFGTRARRQRSQAPSMQTGESGARRKDYALIH